MPFATPFAFCKIYLTGNAKLPASYWHCHWQNNWQNNWQMPHKNTAPETPRLATQVPANTILPAHSNATSIVHKTTPLP